MQNFTYVLTFFFNIGQYLNHEIFTFFRIFSYMIFTLFEWNKFSNMWFLTFKYIVSIRHNLHAFNIIICVDKEGIPLPDQKKKKHSDFSFISFIFLAYIQHTHLIRKLNNNHKNVWFLNIDCRIIILFCKSEEHVDDWVQWCCQNSMHWTLKVSF